MHVTVTGAENNKESDAAKCRRIYDAGRKVSHKVTGPAHQVSWVGSREAKLKCIFSETPDHRKMMVVPRFHQGCGEPAQKLQDLAGMPGLNHQIYMPRKGMVVWI